MGVRNSRSAGSPRIGFYPRYPGPQSGSGLPATVLHHVSALDLVIATERLDPGRTQAEERPAARLARLPAHHRFETARNFLRVFCRSAVDDLRIDHDGIGRVAVKEHDLSTWRHVAGGPARP